MSLRLPWEEDIGGTRLTVFISKMAVLLYILRRENCEIYLLCCRKITDGNINEDVVYLMIEEREAHRYDNKSRDTKHSRSD